MIENTILQTFKQGLEEQRTCIPLKWEHIASVRIIIL